MKYKKDAKVRKEWGSIDGLIIDEDYVPEPLNLSPTQDCSSDNLKQDGVLHYSDTSSTSDSEENSSHNQTTGYEKILKKLEKKRGKISKEDFTLI